MTSLEERMESFYQTIGKVSLESARTKYLKHYGLFGGCAGPDEYFPIARHIHKIFRDFLSEQKETGKQSTKKKVHIMECVEQLESFYKEKCELEKGFERGTYQDWITIEAFPGMKKFFWQTLGTGEEFSSFLGIAHWIEDLQVTEGYLLR